MATNISIKLDVTKIDKAKLYKGDKGTYLDATILMKDEADQYGNIGMIVQNVSKEEREAGAATISRLERELANAASLQQAFQSFGRGL